MLFTCAALFFVSPASAQETSASRFESLIAMHAAANGVPASLVHRVIRMESRYNPRAVGRGGAMGLMQIKHATARGLGYSGSAAGLLDPATNLTYGVRYLAGAYRTADGQADRAVSYYQRGYYFAAKRKGLTREASAQKVQRAQRRARAQSPWKQFQAWLLRGGIRQ
jgi:soluble lytic murein transglycosylase-like protein